MLHERVEEEGHDMLTHKIVTELFDDIFERTTNVHFVAQTKREFERYVKDHEVDSGRPALLLHFNTSSLIDHEVRRILKYLTSKDMFDLYLDCSDDNSMYFAYASIVDKSEITMIKPSNLVIDLGEENLPDPMLNNFYYKRYESSKIWFSSDNLEQQIDMLIENFLDQPEHHYKSDSPQLPSSVQKISGIQFDEWVRSPGTS